MPVKLPNLQTVEMMRCEACGELHPVSECEVVIIKMIKGKDCKIEKKVHLYEEPVSLVVPNEFNSVAEKIAKDVKKPKVFVGGKQVDLDSLDNIDIPGQKKTIPDPKEAEGDGKKPSIVPKEFRGVFIQPDSPGAAKETRIA